MELTNGIDWARLVADLHASQDDLVQKAHEALLNLGQLARELRQSVVPVHKIIVVNVVHMRTPILKADEFALLLEQLVVFWNVLVQNHKGQIDCALDVAVIRARHCTVDRLVWTRDERLVPLHIVGYVGRTMPLCCVWSCGYVNIYMCTYIYAYIYIYMYICIYIYTYIRPTQSIMYVPLQVNGFQKNVLLIVQYKYLKSCPGDFCSPESDLPHKIMRYYHSI